MSAALQNLCVSYGMCQVLHSVSLQAPAALTVLEVALLGCIQQLRLIMLHDLNAAAHCAGLWRADSISATTCF